MRLLNLSFNVEKNNSSCKVVRWGLSFLQSSLSPSFSKALGFVCEFGEGGRGGVWKKRKEQVEEMDDIVSERHWGFIFLHKTIFSSFGGTQKLYWRRVLRGFGWFAIFPYISNPPKPFPPLPSKLSNKALRVHILYSSFSTQIFFVDL